MNIQQIKQGAFLNIDEIVLVLDVPVNREKKCEAETGDREHLKIINQSKIDGQFYDLSGSEPLLSLIVLRNGSVIGTGFLSKTLVRNRFQCTEQDLKNKSIFHGAAKSRK